MMLATALLEAQVAMELPAREMLKKRNRRNRAGHGCVVHRSVEHVQSNDAGRQLNYASVTQTVSSTDGGRCNAISRVSITQINR